jgi:NTP pyrophosphatase (non-canonical NTP hydrolase)
MRNPNPGGDMVKKKYDNPVHEEMEKIADRTRDKMIKNVQKGFEDSYGVFRCAIKQLIVTSGAMASLKGFHDKKRSGAECIALMHEELSEALWALRHDRPKSEKIPDYENLEEELADVVIRICDYCHTEQLDLAGAIYAKLKYNAGRPLKHGKAF